MAGTHAATPHPTFDASIGAMTLPDQLSEPAVLIIGAAVLLGIVWMIFGMRRRVAERDTAQVIAAVQAERDVLRANHAVEIATLEGKLAEAQERARKNMDTALRLKEAERQMEALRTRATAAETEAAERSAQVEALEAELGALREGGAAAAMEERDRARRELAEQSELVARLRAELEDATAKLAEASGAEGKDVVVALTRERDQARDEARRLTETVAELRQEVAGLMRRLEAGGTDVEGERRLAAEVALLSEREARLKATVREREETIAELRRALSAGEAPADDERVERLTRELVASRARERSAHESLSRLAYEADGLRNRLSSLEQGDSASKAEVEKRDALLELRLQKIYELEAKLRDQHALLMRTQRRAEVAEESLASLAAEATGGGDGASPAAAAEAEERARRLEKKLGEVRAENSSLLSELDALRRAAEAGATDGSGEAAGADELTALREQVETLEARNAALQAELDAARSGRSDAPSMDAREAEAIRKELRALAERFLERAGVADAAPEAAEPSLAERIRAFKAARQMERRN